MTALDVLDAELASPVYAGMPVLEIVTRNSVYRLHRGHISGGIVGAPVRYATARRVGAHLVVRDEHGRLLVETSSVRVVRRVTF